MASSSRAPTESRSRPPGSSRFWRSPRCWRRWFPGSRPCSRVAGTGPTMGMAARGTGSRTRAVQPRGAGGCAGPGRCVICRVRGSISMLYYGILGAPRAAGRSRMRGVREGQGGRDDGGHCWRAGPSNTDVRASVRWALLGRPDAPKLRPRRARVPALRRPAPVGRPHRGAIGHRAHPQAPRDTCRAARPPARPRAALPRRGPLRLTGGPRQASGLPRRATPIRGDRATGAPCRQRCARTRGLPLPVRPRGRLAPDPCLPAPSHRSSLPCVWEIR